MGVVVRYLQNVFTISASILYGGLKIHKERNKNIDTEYTYMSHYFDEKNPLFMEPKVTQYGPHMVMTNVVKPLKRKFINIDTRYRDDYNTTSVANYNMTLPERILNIKSAKVQSIEIPMSFYNISANLGNNAFNITVVGVMVTIVIPDGQYESDVLVDTINDQIACAGVPYTNIIFSIENNFSVFSNSDPNNTYFIDFDITQLGTTDMNINNLMFKLGWLLGFRYPSYNIPPVQTLTSSTFYDLLGPRYLYLIVDEYQNSNPHSFVSLLRTSQIASGNVLARITLDSKNYPFGAIMPATEFIGYLTSDTRTYAGIVNLERMNIQLVNERGIPMNLNGLDFSFCLELQHE